MLPVLPVLGAAGACEDRQAAPLRRSGPLGSLRDLVLFDRSTAAGGPFFLDRFEVTRGDWAQFAATPAGEEAGARPPPLERPEDAALPMGGVDLREARAFARWRRCRLPRRDEWWFACTNDGRNPYPWGSIADASRANTAALGLWAPLPVGTFESGRRGDGPYDLIGNVAEWTETVPNAWFQVRRENWEDWWLLPTALRRVQASAGLAVWALPGGVVPACWVVAAAGDRAPREVLGGHFLSLPRHLSELRAPSDHSNAIGCRLAASPVELARAVAAGRADYGPGDLEQLRRFLRRGAHAAVMRRAIAQAQLAPAARAFLEQHLPEP